MAELKTKVNDGDVHDFIHAAADTDQKKQDSFALLKLMEEVTGFEAKMWGASMIGFGQYHYESERSTQKGDWLMVGFSPRKAAISLYVYTGLKAHAHLLENLGKFKMGKACIYIKKLSDIDQEALKVIILTTVNFLTEKYKT